MVGNITLPVPQISAPTFGNNTLYVNTANLVFDPYTLTIGAPNRTPPAGNLFMVQGLGVQGILQYDAEI